MVFVCVCVWVGGWVGGWVWVCMCVWVCVGVWVCVCACSFQLRIRMCPRSATRPLPCSADCRSVTGP